MEIQEIEIIHSWFAPMSLSTGLVYSSQRDDLEVLDEPLFANFRRVTGLVRLYRDDLLTKMVAVIDGRVIGDGKVGPMMRTLQNVYKALTAELGEPIPMAREHIQIGILYKIYLNSPLFMSFFSWFA